MAISGIYENCIGVADLEAALVYWREFGYTPIAEGTLSADAAAHLYGHDSALRSVRLQNGAIDTHGLLRLFAWETLRDGGIGQVPPLTVGGRWFIQNTADIWLIKDMFDDLRDLAHEPYIVSTPARAQMKFPPNAPSAIPSVTNRRIGVRELMVLGEEVRQAFFQRYGYERPGYGTINGNAPLKTSEATHSSFIIADDSHGQFYVDALGMINTNPLHVSNGANPGNAETLMIRPEQEFTIMGFMAPGAVCGMFQFYKPLWETENVTARSRPGGRGLTLSTFKVDDIDRYHQQVIACGARDVTAVHTNEFGERSFSFIAPDGVFWTILS
ncbi:MAG: hypothetical protein NZ518_03415 [Dehalococcoidia bacterium]|nr:hypothetical protein [Dehalococcoidia bacterium]